MPYLCSPARATRDLQVFLGNKWAPGCNLKQAESANRKGTNRWKRNQNNNKNRCLLNLVQGHYFLKTSIVVFIKSWSSFILMLVGNCFMPSFSIAKRMTVRKSFTPFFVRSHLDNCCLPEPISPNFCVLKSKVAVSSNKWQQGTFQKQNST